MTHDSTTDAIVLRLTRWHIFVLGVVTGALAYAMISMLLAPAPANGAIPI